MRKFKAGDRVLAIRSGAIGLVKETSTHVTSVDVSGVLTWFNTDDLVVAPAVSSGTNFTLTRRDHFAMAAMTGLYVLGSTDYDFLASSAYELADAMETARNKGGRGMTDQEKLAACLETVK